jgi:CO/xanthine dehydrogenase FAD-binding subunit
MNAFDYERVTSIEEAVNRLAQANGNGHGPGHARVLSGGTDLLIALREGKLSAGLIIDVKFIPEVNELTYDAAGLHIGAAVPCHRINGNTQIAAAYPGLLDAVRLIGGVQIQGRASLGGNLCNASPAADSVPALIAYGATAEIAGSQGMRAVPVAEFCLGPGKTVLLPGEFLVQFHLPPPRPGFGAAYLRFTPRNEMDIAVVGVGASVQLDAQRTHFASARIALGAVAPTALLVTAAGEALAGQPIGPAAINQAAVLAEQAARPISDMRGTADYRRHLVGVLTRRTLSQAIARATAQEVNQDGR